MGKTPRSLGPLNCFNPPNPLPFFVLEHSVFSSSSLEKGNYVKLGHETPKFRGWTFKIKTFGWNETTLKNYRTGVRWCVFLGGGILLEPPGFGVIPSLKTWAINNEKKHPVSLFEVVGFQGVDWCFSFREKTSTSYCRSTKTNDHHPTKTSGIHLAFGGEIYSVWKLWAFAGCSTCMFHASEFM